MAAADAAVTGSSGRDDGGRPILVVEDLHVTYRVYEDHKASLRSFVANRFRPRQYREIKAVRGVTLQAHPGEAIGIVGRNGSGKSTLLRAIAGLLPPTSGVVYGRSEPMLLGVSAVLNAHLSGRRNVYLGGLALGMSRTQIDSQFDEIVEFAGLEDFIDMPLRTYSSGMAARLHFSIASAVKPEVLLVDEALAVGDLDFKQRSKERMRELLDAAGTIFLVSHSLGSIQEICTRALWMEQGQVLREGEPEQIIAAYQKRIANQREWPKPMPVGAARSA